MLVLLLLLLLLLTWIIVVVSFGCMRYRLLGPQKSLSISRLPDHVPVVAVVLVVVTAAVVL